MEYSIYNILNEYVSNYGKNIIIIFQNLDKYEGFLDGGNPIYLVTKPGYYEGFEDILIAIVI